MPRVTVIMATYNWSTVLPYSIGSVLRQTFTDFELLVVGDGCTDDSEQVVTAIDDPRVRWINLSRNTRHQSGPNNEGLRQARGDLIAYLGHDDLWLPHHLEVMVAAVDRTDAGVAYSLTMVVAGGGDLVFPALPRPAAGTFAAPLGLVHRRRLTEQLGGWRDYRELTIGPDVELLRRMDAAGVPFTFVRRLTGIKFPAAFRRDVYAIRPCHEQARWTARILAEPDFEVDHLAEFVVGRPVPAGLPYGDMAREFWRQTSARLRLRRAGVIRWPLRRRLTIDAQRRFKGL